MRGSGSHDFLLPSLEVNVIGEFAHLLEILEDGQLRPHLHPRCHNLLGEISGLVELEAQLGNLRVAEEVLEVVDGGHVLAEDPHLFKLLRIEMLDQVVLLQLIHSLRMHVLA